MIRIILSLVIICSIVLIDASTLIAQTDYSNSNATNRAKFLPQAISILESVPLIDGHNDVPIQYRSRVRYKISQLDFNKTSDLERPMHTDIPRMKAGRLGGQFWSVYVPTNIPESESVQITLEQIDFVKRLIDTYPDVLEIAHTADDIERVFAGGKVASLIGMEGGQSIGNSLHVLRQMYELGARYMSITHGRTLDWADSATDTPRHGGLTGFGKEVIREMNWLGMMVDLSHASAPAMRDAITISTAPVIFSHSSAMGLNNHPRNVPDDVLDMVKENNGIVMVTYVPSFISEELHQHISNRNAERARLDYYYVGQPDVVSQKMREWDTENHAPVATLETLANHIDYIKNRIGIDHIGIGGDYDGISLLPEGLKDVSTYPDLFAELLYRGYTENELKKIAGLNILRVMRDVEDEAAKLQASRPHASEAVIGDYQE